MHLVQLLKEYTQTLKLHKGVGSVLRSRTLIPKGYYYLLGINVACRTKGVNYYEAKLAKQKISIDYK